MRFSLLATQLTLPFSCFISCLRSRLLLPYIFFLCLNIWLHRFSCFLVNRTNLVVIVPNINTVSSRKHTVCFPGGRCSQNALSAIAINYYKCVIVSLFDTPLFSYKPCLFARVGFPPLDNDIAIFGVKFHRIANAV